MRQIAEGAKVLAVLLIAGAVFAVSFKFGMSSYTEYLEKNRQHDKEVHAEALAEERHKEEIRLEEANARKAQINAQLAFTQEQNLKEEIKLKIVHEDLEKTKKELELKVQAEKTAKIAIDLEKEAQRTLEKEAALKVNMPTRTFVLKDGTIIKATRWLESGPEWIVKNEAGNLVKIHKDQLER